jgi:hypothetical protein
VLSPSFPDESELNRTTSASIVVKMLKTGLCFSSDYDSEFFFSPDLTGTLVFQFGRNEPNLNAYYVSLDNTVNSRYELMTVYLPTTSRKTLVDLAGACLKSTRHLYCPLSDSWLRRDESSPLLPRIAAYVSILSKLKLFPSE